MSRDSVVTMRHFLTVFLIGFIFGCGQKNNKENGGEGHDGMVWISGGTFIMGTDDRNSYPHEQPAHSVAVDGFWMDITEVTNKQFNDFVEATGYITTAERIPDWEQLKEQLPPDAPKPPDSILVAGSLVFIPPKGTVNLNDYSQWWHWTAGANWRHPEGPDSNINERMNHPAVHIAWDDAMAYCMWANKRLPTEAEWELAARGGAVDSRYAWGEELTVNGRYVANTFQGSFPGNELIEDGFSGTSPVKSFPPNAFGLYDIIGNVWEWTSDWYDADYYNRVSKSDLIKNPTGSAKPYDPYEPYSKKRVTKGGSFLCASNYCVNYRPSARQGTAVDSGLSNVGFRCVKD